MPMLAAAVAHEFNEELMIILNHADVALRRLGAAHPAREFVLELELAAQRCAGITQGLQAYSQRDGARPERITLTALMADN